MLNVTSGDEKNGNKSELNNLGRLKKKKREVFIEIAQEKWLGDGPR